uniref:Poly(A) RNA polymerase mitochondrial-like central palm domain-containing protein n=1 Tax=Setaria italica TaxID=4555 RepID=K3XS57_SETIT
MIYSVRSFELLKACIEDILSTIKPGEDDRMKRLRAIQELEDSIYSVGALRGAVVKPFGSFISNLYAKSGDLDVSVDLWSSSRPISKKKKQNALRELMRALQIRGVARCMEFIPNARVPIFQYLSNQFGISCDISINNYPGRIKSRIFYWINTIDERFGDMVLLTCEPAILPPLKEIYDGNVAEETVFYDEKHVDEVCMANIERFLCQNMRQRNQNSLTRLLASFFHKVSEYLVEDPFERPDNAARALINMTINVTSKPEVLREADQDHSYSDYTRSHAAGSRTVGRYQNQQRREYSPCQHSGTTRYEPAGGRQFHDAPSRNYGHQASSSNTAWQR